MRGTNYHSTQWLWWALSLTLLTMVNASDETDPDTPKALLESVQDITIGRSVLAGVGIVLGSIIMVAGYRYFRSTMVVCAFVVGGVFVSGAVEAAWSNRNSITLATWISFFIGGLICAALVLCLYKLGVFLVGAFAGVQLAAVLNSSFGYKISASNPTLVFIVLAVVLGIVGGIITCCAERTILILFTSFIGSQLLVRSIGYFAGNYPNSAHLKLLGKKEADGKWEYDIPLVWWAYVAAMVALFVLGAYIQFRKTSSDHVARHVRTNRSAAVGKSTDQVNTPVHDNNTTPQAHYHNSINHV
uniref:Transmembrane protein 198 n=1 Tax=Albugo laibachii Nc14 TaxID=890382 RepID=F0WP75_9STRA|nr:conserved hypothetical protein [Albugo laibachii Nc14]|eukprot:CCA23121.1 conserved hypothetical protein [Albugo laibachii Nc14]